MTLIALCYLFSSCNEKNHIQESVIDSTTSFSDSIFINDFYIHDTFDLQSIYSLIGVPDSLHRGGSEIISEFGADDYDLFYGKSSINAGHGYILEINILDSNLSLNGFKVGQNQLVLNFLQESKNDTISILDNKDGIFNIIIEDSLISEINFYASSL